MKDDFLTRLKAEQKRSGKDFSDIPENYFEKFKTEMLNRVEKKSRIKKLYIRSFIGIAATLLILFGLFFVWRYWENSNEVKHYYNGYAIAKDSMFEKPTPDTIPYYDYNTIADTLLLDDIPKEYLLQYLLESEEFEF